MSARASIADASPRQYAAAIAIPDPTPPHHAIASISVGTSVVIRIRASVVAAAVVRGAEAERQTGAEAPAKTATTPVATTAMPVAAAMSVVLGLSRARKRE
jgi:hypothetical protein